MAGTVGAHHDWYPTAQNSPFWQKREEDENLTAGKYDINNVKQQLLPHISALGNNAEKCATAGLGIVRLVTENLVCHPFIVLRRQCQVNVFSRRYHLVPVTLFPVILKIHQRQGLTVLWKGIGSFLIVKGLALAVEDFLSKVTPWPKEITRHSTLKAIGHHLLLKCVSLAIVAPFYAASIVETVQSEIASEKPGIFEVFQEGFHRLLSWSAPQTGRLLPIWIIITPTVVIGALQYVTTVLASGLTRWGLGTLRKQKQRKHGAISKDSSGLESNGLDMMSRFAGSLITDILFYPADTVLNRLHIQGTRTIIDNLDTGSNVVPILTRYDGFFDCWTTIVTQEGHWGLYKGFGALIMQHCLQLAILKSSYFAFTQMGSLLHPTSPPPRLPTPKTPASPQTSEKTNVMPERIRSPRQNPDFDYYYSRNFRAVE